MLKEFKTFILKGDVVSLSTGVIIGASFTGIVTAFTKGIVDPLLKLANRGKDPNVTLPVWIFDFGIIINALVSFLITAAVIFFVIVKPYNLFMARVRKADAPPSAGPSEEILLLREIRDSLKKDTLVNNVIPRAGS